jgi:hypothetical protein
MAEASDSKNVILVQTTGNLALPYMATTELIQVAALSHQHVIGLKFYAGRNAFRQLDHGYVFQVEVPVLNVANAQVGSFN